MSGVRLAAIDIAGESAPWVALGLSADGDGRIPFSNGALEFVAAGEGGSDLSGVVGLAVDGVDDLASSIDGVAVRPGRVVPAVEHPIDVLEIDHIVIMTDSLERTSEAVTDTIGLECRRIRETDTVRQAFHRFADQGGRRGCIIEIVENARVHSPALFGLVLNVGDIHDVAGRLGPELLSNPKPAVQSGRQIATVRSEAGLGVAVALMSPDR